MFIYEFWETNTPRDRLLWETKDIHSLKDYFFAWDNTYIRVCRPEYVPILFIHDGNDWDHYTKDFYDMKMSEALEVTSTKEEEEEYSHMKPLSNDATNEMYRSTKIADNNPKTLAALSKPRLSDVPPVALFALGAAMSDGASKYGRYNYRDTSVTSSVFYDAIMRHLVDWYNGEDFAHDSKVHHLGHIMASCAILLDGELHGTLNDDRDMRKPASIARNPTWKQQ